MANVSAVTGTIFRAHCLDYKKDRARDTLSDAAFLFITPDWFIKGENLYSCSLPRDTHNVLINLS